MNSTLATTAMLGRDPERGREFTAIFGAAPSARAAAHARATLAGSG
jgi:hypothetical protein